VPFDPTHPDPEQLAAWQAGELAGPDGVQVEAHVAGCAQCTRLVAMADRGRAALAALPEVEAPASLHHRLAAALERELEVADGVHQPLATENGVEERRLTAVADGNGQGEPTRAGEPGPAGVGEPGSTGEATRPGGLAPVGRQVPAGEPVHAGTTGWAGEHAAGARPVPLAGRRRRDARPRDRRLVALLSAAAAVILLVAGLVPLLRHTGGQTAVTADRGPTTAAPNALAGGGAAGSLPVFSAPDGYSGSALQSALTSDPQARAAYRAASSGRPSTAGPESVNPQLSGGSGGEKSGSSNTAAGGATGSSAAPAPSGLQQDACVGAARSQARNQGLQPAFFVDTVYQGRPATVLVTVRPGAAGQADLWAFPRGNCSSPPFDHEPVGVTPP
jgi:hypothetical protein